MVIERTAEALAEAGVVHVIQNWPALLAAEATPIQAVLAVEFMGGDTLVK